MSAARQAVGLYVHWPFCVSKCPYCDFNSHVGDAVDHGRWRRALLAELDHYAAQVPDRRVASLFFGGGTPSLMHPDTVAAVIDRMGDRWAVERDVEITLEANPGATETDRLGAFRDAGVNRISIGVQALDDAALGFLGRAHDTAEARAAVERAHKVFPRVSFDMIYARPGQTVTDWRAELGRALDMAGEHVSVYQLTIEPGTPLHGAHRRGDFSLPREPIATALFDATQEMLAAAGRPAYEISNHARPGAACRHNVATWQGGDYVGIGPGAHGRLTVDGRTEATAQIRAPRSWLAAVEAGGHATAERVTLTDAERLEEILLTGLRLTAGIGRDRFRALVGMAIEEALPAAPLARLAEAGLVERDARGMRATPRGRLLLDSVVAALVP